MPQPAYRPLWTCAVAVCVAAVSLYGFVGVHDSCPVPTPYPPPGAGWAVVHNPSFENGFVNGAASQWVAWKDATYTGQVHFDGTDQKYDGQHSQKFELPQPPAGTTDQSAGLYQQIYVVPGQIYTATARVRLHFPPQTYNGEDLVARLGLDPYGEPDGDGFGTVWTDMVASQDQWILASVQVQAVLPVMTVTLKATRKWAQHGNGALAWFDQITFTGPVPTDPPPEQDPDPIDPETLIPETVGGNLVGNPSFEEAFSNGVSSGWNKWWTAGTGTWKRSQRVGKVGGGNYAWCGVVGDLEDMKAMKAKTYLVQDRKSYAGELGAEADLVDSIIVGRIFIDPYIEQYLSNPTHYGRVHADNCYSEQLNHPRIDCWQGLNEPDWGTDKWYDVLAFEKAFAERCHELRIKSCVLNLSTGSPGNIWRILDARELLEEADYLGHHVYGGPADQLMVNNQNMDDACSFSLRARRFKDMYERRGWRFPPVIYTEGTTYFGWHGTFSPQQIANDLILYGQYQNADRWNAGLTIFDVGGCGLWAEWDITGTGIAQQVGAWNQANPADAMHGLYSQMFGAGKVHPMTTGEMSPAGVLNGGINRQIGGLTVGQGYLAMCWLKWEFRGVPPTQLTFHIGIDPTGQTSNGNAATIDWGEDQIAGKAQIHDMFTHAWRTFTAGSGTVSLWLRAAQPIVDPSFMCYVDVVEVRELAAPPGPEIAVWPSQIGVSAVVGTSPPAGSFNIQNAGSGTITYSFQTDCDWVQLDPPGGTSSGETDVITILYDTGDLVGQTHECQVTVTAPEASNSPLAAPRIILTLVSIAPDFDADGDVDQSDFGHFQKCLTGQGATPPPPGCDNADLDNDQDVDQTDFNLFYGCMSGAGVAPEPDCM